MTDHYTKADLEAAYKFGQSGHSWQTFSEWFKPDREWSPISGEDWEIISVESPGDPISTKSYDCYGMYNDE